RHRKARVSQAHHAGVDPARGRDDRALYLSISLSLCPAKPHMAFTAPCWKTHSRAMSASRPNSDRPSSTSRAASVSPRLFRFACPSRSVSTAFPVYTAATRQRSIFEERPPQKDMLLVEIVAVTRAHIGDLV